MGILFVSILINAFAGILKKEKGDSKERRSISLSKKESKSGLQVQLLKKEDLDCPKSRK